MSEVSDALAVTALQRPTPQEDEMEDVRWFHRWVGGLLLLLLPGPHCRPGYTACVVGGGGAISIAAAVIDFVLLPAWMGLQEQMEHRDSS
jgi:hypothetical protein